MLSSHVQFSLFPQGTPFSLPLIHKRKEKKLYSSLAASNKEGSDGLQHGAAKLMHADVSPGYYDICTHHAGHADRQRSCTWARGPLKDSTKRTHMDTVIKYSRFYSKV